MDRWKGATLACPVCGDHNEIIIPADTPAGTVLPQRCAAGHEFRSRVGTDTLEVLAPPAAAATPSG